MASGKFVATGANKKIQHLEGGIIKEIRAKEGGQVEQGATRVVLDFADLAAQAEHAEKMALTPAAQADLIAELQGLVRELRAPTAANRAAAPEPAHR